MPKYITVKDCVKLQKQFKQYSKTAPQRQLQVVEAVHKRLDKVVEEVKSEGTVTNQAEMRAMFRAVLKIMKADHTEYADDK